MITQMFPRLLLLAALISGAAACTICKRLGEEKCGKCNFLESTCTKCQVLCFLEVATCNVSQVYPVLLGHLKRACDAEKVHALVFEGTVEERNKKLGARFSSLLSEKDLNNIKQCSLEETNIRIANENKLIANELNKEWVQFGTDYMQAHLKTFTEYTGLLVEVYGGIKTPENFIKTLGLDPLPNSDKWVDEVVENAKTILKMEMNTDFAKELLGAFVAYQKHQWDSFIKDHECLKVFATPVCYKSLQNAGYYTPDILVDLLKDGVESAVPHLVMNGVKVDTKDVDLVPKSLQTLKERLGVRRRLGDSRSSSRADSTLFKAFILLLIVPSLFLFYYLLSPGVKEMLATL